MTDHTHRVIVRGRFDALDDTARTALLDAADAHDSTDVFNARFSADGNLTYDRRLTGFTLRCEITLPRDAGTGDLRARAEALLAAALAPFGCGHRDLDIRATDMDEIKIRRR
ncbi:DUF6204 family protein [Saccharopolyspora taberi]|uniref:Isomerase n=1 Tax=Saccharopolyspora taberi TaxID=60895 RepID=A0ABN3VDT6_9PSEU